MINTQALIQRWRAGDERAAEILYNEYYDQVFRLTYGLLDNRADAEEVTQDALAYALSKIVHFKPEKASFKTWLNTITVCRCRNRYRRKQFVLLPLTAWLRSGGDVADSTPTQENNVIREEIRNEVWQAVQELNTSLKEAILLRHWAGHTYREMAEILDCPIATAQSRVRLAHERLQTILASSSLANLGEIPEKNL